MPTGRLLFTVLAVASALGLVACGGGPATVTDETVLTEQQVETDVQTDVVTDVETEEQTECPAGEVLSSPGNKCRPADDSEDADPGDCPAGEVLSAPGNKCRPADDPDDDPNASDSDDGN